MIQDKHEFEALEGVVYVREGFPIPGCVTLVVEDGFQDAYDDLSIPPGCQLFTVVAGSQDDQDRVPFDKELFEERDGVRRAAG